MKALWREERGGQPVPLTAEERRDLKAKLDALSPKMLKDMGWTEEDARLFGVDERSPGPKPDI